MTDDPRTLLEQVADAVVARLVDQCILFEEQAVEEESDRLGLPVDERKSLRLVELIGQQVFWCDGCGWCCSTDELNNEGSEDLCDDCNDSGGI